MSTEKSGAPAVEKPSGRALRIETTGTDTKWRRDAVALLEQWLAGRSDGKFLQLRRQAGAVSVGFCGRQALAELKDLVFAGTAPANLGPAAGCGHSTAPGFNCESEV